MKMKLKMCAKYREEIYLVLTLISERRFSASKVSATEHSPTVIRSFTPSFSSDSVTSSDSTPVKYLNPEYKSSDLHLNKVVELTRFLLYTKYN